MQHESKESVDISRAANDVGIDALAAKLSSYLPAEHIHQVRLAYELADIAHAGQKRRSGEPYVSHPLAVADILADMRLDYQTLCAAIMHDVIEDTSYTKDDIIQGFGESIADLVDGVSKLTQIKFESKAIAQAENFQKMALAMAKDIRVILVKLADRLHNIRTLGALPIEKKKRIARETLDIYAPLALRLGINSFRVEFEDRCFEAIYPMRARRIKAALRSTSEERSATLEKIRMQIQEHLEERNFKVQVIGRQKHLYSIYTKMKRKRKALSDIMDVYACRIIVEDEEDCYRVLGAVHSLYKPISRKFKDYIAIPKANGYQSLHTVLFGLRVPIEIQIRSKDMEEISDRGVAAHWLYKNSQDPNEDFAPGHLRAKRWLQGVLEMQEQSGSSVEFVEHFKTNLFSDEVYVFTPKGNILELPTGATAVDFAYAVHTDVGNMCIGCTINRRPASLNQTLESGQTVSIKTAPDAQPKSRWLDFVVTGKARSNIRHHLKRQRYNDAINLGERLLDKAAVSLDLPEVYQLKERTIKKLLEETQYDEMQYLLEDIGLGNRSGFLTAQQLQQILHKDDSTKTDLSAINKSEPLYITGTEGMLVNFAKCCHPVPGDHIAGCTVGGSGVDVHLHSCYQFKDILKKGRHLIDLHWADDIEQTFSIEIEVKIESESSTLPYLALKLDQYGTHIDNMQLVSKENNLNVVRIELMVHDRVHLARIMRLLRNNKQVVGVTRVKSKKLDS